MLQTTWICSCSGVGLLSVGRGREGSERWGVYDGKCRLGHVRRALAGWRNDKARAVAVQKMDEQGKNE